MFLKRVLKNSVIYVKNKIFKTKSSAQNSQNKIFIINSPLQKNYIIFIK